MPEYPLRCRGCGKETVQIHSIKAGHDPCRCGGVNETDFSKPMNLQLDGVSQEGWPREEHSVRPVLEGGKIVPRKFESRRDMDNYFAKRGKYAGRPGKVLLRG